MLHPGKSSEARRPGSDGRASNLPLPDGHRPAPVFVKSARGRGVAALALAASLAFASPLAGEGVPSPAPGPDESRYGEIRRLILGNLHWSGHMVRAVDGRTITAVRPFVSERDVPVLIRMLGDREARAGLGASGLLACLGDASLPALEAAVRSREFSVASRAGDALAHIADCRGPERERYDPRLCPPCETVPR